MSNFVKIRYRLVCLTFSLFALTGCASIDGFPDDVIKPSDDLAQMQVYFAPTVLNAYDTQSGENARRAYRDEVVYARLHAYDVQYHVFLRALSREAGSTSITADFLALTLNGVGATVGSAGTKAALAAASGGVIGAQGDINKELFYSKALPAIVAQMEAERTQVRAIIEKGLDLPDAEYSLPKAIVDLDLYQTAGSLPGALNGIVQDAGTKTDASQKAISETRDHSFTLALPKAVAIGDQISALTDAQALALAKIMEPNLKSRSQFIQDFVGGNDPGGKRLTDGATAKTILKQWSLMDRDAAFQKQWSDALAAIAGG